MYFMLIACIAGIIVTFSVQNVNHVALSFLIWQFDVPVSAVIVFSVLAGIVVVQLLQSGRKQRINQASQFISRRR